MSKTENLLAVENLVVPIIHNLGLTFVDLSLEKQYGNLTLTVFIDKQDGVTLDDCEAVSKAIDAPLDSIDFTNGKSYNLNVSSPGLNRPLTKEIDYVRNMGKEIQVKFYKPFLNKKVHTGILVKFTDTDFTINTNGQEITINKNLVALNTPVIKF